MTQVSFHGDSPVIGTARNIERSGKRSVTKLSTIARKVPGIRAIDIDLVPYCPRCKHPLAFCESKRTLVSDAEWDQMRRHARHYGHGVIALLVIEPDAGPLGVKVYDPAADSISPVSWGGEEFLLHVLGSARDSHACY